MLNFITKSSKLFALLFSIVLFSSSFGFADDGIKEVREFKVDLNGTKQGDTFVASGVVSWVYPSDDSIATGFNIYVAEGRSEDMSDFQLLKYVDKFEDNHPQKPYFYQFGNLKSAKNGWTFTITAVGDNKQSDASRFFYAEIKNSPPPNKIFISSNPSNIASIDVEYKYSPTVETNFDNPTITYSLHSSPDDATINAETGEIKWTPTKSGNYNFVLDVKAISGDVVLGVGNQQWFVTVKECDELATVKGTVVDESGVLIDMGVVTVIKYEPDNDKIHKSPVLNVRFDNGEFVINHLDKGKYYILVEAYGKNNTTSYYPMWYDNALSFDDATALIVDCGDELTISFTLQEVVKPNFYSVSGKVLDAETLNPVVNSVVEFRGIDNHSDKVQQFAFKTTHNGTFEGKLPDSFTYTAVAHGYYKTDSSNYPQAYFPQYFDLADNPTDAKSLLLVENKSDINFYLVRVPNYNNSLYGTVTNADSEVVAGALVTAFLVSSDNRNSKYIYTGKAVETDEFGAYTIENLIPGKYVVLARTQNKMLAPGFYVEDDLATISWEDATRVTVDEEGASGSYKIMLSQMERNDGKGRIRGKIRKDHKGIIKSGEVIQSDDGVLGASVFLVNSNNNVIRTLVSDELGNFDLGNIAAGTYTLVLDKIGYSSSRTEITVDENTLLEQEFGMSPMLTTSVNYTDLGFEFEVYPNPAVEAVNVSLGSITIPCQISLLDYTGAEVIKIESAGNGGLEIINTSKLPSGMYFIKIQNANSVSIKSIVILK